jgi:mannose-1-phosphate guanylyltransferase
VINGDSLLEIRLRDVIEYHRARGAIATMVVRPDPEAARYGLIELDATDRVRRLVGLPQGTVSDPLRGFMFPGLHVFEPSIFGWMDADIPYSIVRVTYPKVLAAGLPVYGWVTKARWVTIDTPAALADADALLRRQPFRF